MGIGNVLSESLSKGMQSSSSGPAQAGGAAPAVPDVMTPSEAASYLKVAEEDVVAAIEEGQLKARKIGKAYRISEESLDEFLGG